MVCSGRAATTCCGRGANRAAPGPPMGHCPRSRGCVAGRVRSYTWALSGTKSQLESAAEAFFAELRRVCASGGATGERSAYGPLMGLLDVVGATLKPRVFCASAKSPTGAQAIPISASTRRMKQAQRGKPRPGQAPERGAVEVKPAGDDAWLAAAGDRVSRYWGRYRLVLATDTRDFVLVGAGADGRPVRLSRFRFRDRACTVRGGAFAGGPCAARARSGLSGARLPSARTPAGANPQCE